MSGEARRLFERFTSSTKNQSHVSTGLKTLEAAVRNMNPKQAIPPLPHFIAALTELKERLENMAWLPLYREARAHTQSDEAAWQWFEKRFIARRLKNIEVHEGAHLLDVEHHPNDIRQSSKPGRHFNRQTELNAFFAELKYGGMPRDALAHALARMIDELTSQRTIDHSHQKVLAVLNAMAVDSDRWLARRSDVDCLIGCWLHMSLHDFASLGDALYQKAALSADL
jgi:hypothetical protein